MNLMPARYARFPAGLFAAKVGFAAACLMLLTATITLLPLRAAFGADESQPVARPEVRVGDHWAYRRIDTILDRTQYEYETRVTFVGPEVILTVGSRRGQDGTTDSHWTSDWNPMSTDGFIFTPYAGFLKFPLTIGATLNSSDTTQRSKTERKATVVGWEEISVPAGRFRALKVEIKGIWQLLAGRAGGTSSITIWYVPEVKRWVRFDNQTEWSGGGSNESHQLVEYSLQK